MSSKSQQLEYFGKLQTISITGEKKNSAVVLLHGFGADAQDLAPLSGMMNLSDDIAWYFPDGPLTIPIAPGYAGRAWFPILQRDLERTTLGGRPLILSKQKPTGFDEARELVSDMIEKLPVPRDKIVLGGFSQGAMLATEIALASSIEFAGLAILSGAYINEDIWSNRMHQHRGLKFYQSHGQSDPLLGIDQAKRLFEELQKSGLQGKFESFPGGHEIPEAVIRNLGHFIKDCLV